MGGGEYETADGSADEEAGGCANKAAIGGTDEAAIEIVEEEGRKDSAKLFLISLRSLAEVYSVGKLLLCLVHEVAVPAGIALSEYLSAPWVASLTGPTSEREVAWGPVAKVFSLQKLGNVLLTQRCYALQKLRLDHIVRVRNSIHCFKDVSDGARNVW